jgi:PAS domain S-box-containing protein
VTAEPQVERRSLLRRIRDERHDVEEALKQLRANVPCLTVGEELADVLETASVLACIADRDRYLWANAAWEQVLGWGPGEVAGRRVLDFVYEGDRDATIRAMDALNTGPIRGTFSNRLITKDGGIRTVMWLSSEWKEDGRAFAIALPLDVCPFVTCPQRPW